MTHVFTGAEVRMRRRELISRRQLLERGGVVTGGVLLSEAALGPLAREAWALAGDAPADVAAAMPKRVLGNFRRWHPE